MLSAHRQADDEHSKWYVLIKGNRNLKPHQPGMAKTGEVQQGFVGSTHWEQDRSLSRGPFSFIRLSVWLVVPTTGLSCSGLSSKGWFRLCVAGERAYSSVRWSRPRTVTGGTPVALPLYGIQTPISAVRISCAQLCWNVRCKHFSYFCILLENPRPYYNITGFPIKCFS